MKFSELKSQIDEAQRNSAKSDEAVRVKNLEVILNIVKSINRTLIIEDVLELVLQNAIKLTNSERGFIVLTNPAGNLEYKIGLDSNNNSLSENLFNVSTTVVKDVFETGQSKFIESAQSDTNYDSSKSILRLELQTILCSPLITDEKKIGVIYVDSRQLHKIKIREITDTFEILAGQAATAIRNAQLYNGQINAYNALQEANTQLIQAERKALKSSIDSEIGQSLQGLVHLALLETESLMRTIEKASKDYEVIKSALDPIIVERLKLKPADSVDGMHSEHPMFQVGIVDPILFDRLKLKSKVATDSIRNIQKYAQVLLETSIMNLNKDSGDLNRTIQSVIKYLVPMKKFGKVVFRTEFNTLPPCNYDSEQIQHLFVQLFTNSAEAKSNATILIRSFFENNKVQIIVEDDGPGFPPGNKNSFLELPSSNRSGYGLFLCKSIIDRHNGQIKILDKEKGASIQISLPV